MLQLLESGIATAQFLATILKFQATTQENLDIMIFILLSSLQLIKIKILMEKSLLKLCAFKMKLEEDSVKYFLLKPIKLIMLYMELLPQYVLMEHWWVLPQNKLNMLLVCFVHILFLSELLELENN